MISNQSYFARRALQEAARAARAHSPAAKQWHQELAEKFSRMADECRPDAPVRELATA
jgi:hypothetical protein